MNVTAKVLPAAFQPIEVTIRLDTPDELLSLYDVANHSEKVAGLLRDYGTYGNNHNKVLVDIYKALRSHKDKIA
jgi:hypothetical protein